LELNHVVTQVYTRYSQTDKESFEFLQETCIQVKDGLYAEKHVCT